MEPLPPPSVLAGDTGPGPHALQILTTEHWSLLSSRSLGYTEAMNRVSIFIAALSGAVVALALVAQATDFGTGFHAFALVLLPVVWFLGFVTIVRLGQVNREDAIWVQGMNRIRHAYLEIAPELEPYFVTSTHDDPQGVLRSAMATHDIPWFQGFVAAPGVVAVLDSVVAGSIVGIAVLAADGGTGVSLGLGGAAFIVCLAGFGVVARRSIAASRRMIVVRFPS
jgi:hypothetical protein